MTARRRIVAVAAIPTKESRFRFLIIATLSAAGGSEYPQYSLDAGISKWSAKAESLSRSGQLMPRSQREIASGDADITAASSS